MSLTRWYAKKIYKGICKRLIKNYDIAKKKHSNISGAELYTEAIALRPLWSKRNKNTLLYKSRSELEIKTSDKFRDIVRSVIILETVHTTSWRNQPNLQTESLQDIAEVLNKEFENFRE